MYVSILFPILSFPFCLPHILFGVDWHISILKKYLFPRKNMSFFYFSSCVGNNQGKAAGQNNRSIESGRFQCRWTIEYFVVRLQQVKHFIKHWTFCCFFISLPIQFNHFISSKRKILFSEYLKNNECKSRVSTLNKNETRKKFNRKKISKRKTIFLWIVKMISC